VIKWKAEQPQRYAQALPLLLPLQPLDAPPASSLRPSRCSPSTPASAGGSSDERRRMLRLPPDQQGCLEDNQRTLQRRVQLQMQCGGCVRHWHKV
jgi:hypothetical protein